MGAAVGAKKLSGFAIGGKKVGGAAIGDTKFWPAPSGLITEISDDWSGYALGTETTAPWIQRMNNSARMHFVYDFPPRYVARDAAGTSNRQPDCYTHSTELSSVDHWAQCRMLDWPDTSLSNAAGVVLRRAAGTGSAITVFAGMNQNTWLIAVQNAPVSSNNLSPDVQGSHSLSPGGLLRAEAIGNTVTLLYNDIVLGSHTATLPTGLQAGVFVGRNSSFAAGIQGYVAEWSAGVF
ncbi:hypothetical protein [Hoyosella altamirensis]|uniref:Uncharacterized protein n=1 Tax=Hoyosella altamirensis TaxID=616997 RepID=A0A839RSG2_9ACTN|nr:hypothetical protein [Hoyosella altamirensis]MBB3039805.1 hypothetical protein [Hoyosella altamirensis]